MSHQNDNRQRSLSRQRSQRSNNIFILTGDDYYFIIDKTILKKSGFFENMFALDRHAGKLRNPLFLQTIKSEFFKVIIRYLENHKGFPDKFNAPNSISMCDLCSFYDNDWDKKFFKSLFDSDDPSFMLELLNTVKYFQINNLYKKLKYCYDFYVNMKTYGLYDI